MAAHSAGTAGAEDSQRPVVLRELAILWVLEVWFGLRVSGALPPCSLCCCHTVLRRQAEKPEWQPGAQAYCQVHFVTP